MTKAKEYRVTNYCRSLYWNVREVEENLRAKMDEDRKEILVKLKEVAADVKKENTLAEIRTEKLVRAIKDEGRARRYTRDVRKSVDELDAATTTSRRFTFSRKNAEEEYKTEEARVVESLRKDDANLSAIRQMSRVVRSRRKTRPEAPRPLREHVQVVNVEEDNAGGQQDIIDLE